MFNYCLFPHQMTPCDSCRQTKQRKENLSEDKKKSVYVKYFFFFFACHLHLTKAKAILYFRNDGMEWLNIYSTFLSKEMYQQIEWKYNDKNRVFSSSLQLIFLNVVIYHLMVWYLTTIACNSFHCRFQMIPFLFFLFFAFDKLYYLVKHVKIIAQPCSHFGDNWQTTLTKRIFPSKKTQRKRDFLFFFFVFCHEISSNGNTIISFGFP